MCRRFRLPSFKTKQSTKTEYLSTAQDLPNHVLVERRNEIQYYMERLKDYHIEIGEIPDLCPAGSARRSAIQVAKIVSEDNCFRTLFLKHKSLPIQQLAQESQVCKEVIRKYSKYITAMTVLFVSGCPHLHVFLRMGDEFSQRF